ncbi:CHAT domain-containing protein [Pilimelia anulata]|uniref:CHAT domain-containing protein n=1 Tax=Pilimelia anulata TaxID=53371 RepID=A0A8J3B2J4_9ACTN|nr:CHAT domain-containing protein [Pilimelia anulata]GGJ76024.1 CHAT domain-containing protein [Pilimelia anulata]
MSGEAAELHAQAVRATERGRHDRAWRLLKAALRTRPAPACRARILVSLAFHEAERSSLAAGLALLDEAETSGGLPDRVRGVIAMQRGLLHLRAGATGAALAGFDAAVELLDESDPEDYCRTLLNRGMLRLAPGTLAAARTDFDRCVAIADPHGLTLLAAKARHNLGYLALLAGDLPRALREMDAVAPVLADRSPMVSAVYHLDRARVLLTAGLLREADEDLHRAADLFAAAHSPRDVAEAELERGRLAGRRGRWAEARAHAATARRLFAERGAEPYALVADAVLLATDVGAGRGLAAVRVAGAALAARLRAHGLPDEARRTALTAAAAALARRDGRAGPAAERAVLARRLAGDGLRLRRDDPIGTRMQARALRADLADAEREPRRALAELRAAVADLQEYQASFGSLDLQTAAAVHVEHLAARGLRRALDQGAPAAILAWTERARALSARLAPVRAPADPAAAEMLAELRHATTALRAGALAGKPDPVLRTRCLALQRQIRQRAWYRPGPRQVTAPAPLREIATALGPGALLAHLLVDDHLYALVITARRRVLRPLGPAAAVHELHRRWRADLDALATDALPAALRASVAAAAAAAATRLDDVLTRPLAPLLGDGPVLLAPPARLAALPWTLLPTLRGRPLTVVGSPTAWLSARTAAALPADPAVALAAGPGVARADAEIKLVGEVWPHARTLTGPAATATAVRDAAGAADLVHVAAHGTHEPDNPLFSHLHLADGPLPGHECDGWARPPRHVVLSACELGLSDSRPGDETLGLTAALLHAGAGSVVAGVARLNDETAYEVGPAHHAALRRGLSPAAALAEALSRTPGPAPLVCFGAGW